MVTNVGSAVLDSLRTAVGSAGFVTDPQDLAAKLVDERGVFRGQAPVLLKPATTSEVAAVVQICAAAGVGIVPQGGRTGLCGGTVPVTAGGEVLVSLERMQQIRALDAQGFTMTCEAGCILQTLQETAAASDRLFPLSLGAEGSCTIGGNLSTNAGGINVLRYGMARNLALGLEVVLPDGTIWDDLGGLRKDNRGYDLKQLFIGAEGTLGIITAATVELFPRPRDVDTAFLAVESPAAALELFSIARGVAGDMIVAFELNDRHALDMVFQHIEGTRDPFPARYDWYVLIELAASVEGHARAAGEQLFAAAEHRGLLLDGVRAESLAQRASLWRLRETVSEAQKHEGPSLKTDIAVPVANVPRFIQEATTAVNANWPGYRVLAFGHVGDGNVHFNVFAPRDSSPDALPAASEAIEDIVFAIADGMDGSFSAEHGIGQLKRKALRKFAPKGSLEMMQGLKHMLDPQGIMNPGKVVGDPDQVSRSSRNPASSRIVTPSSSALRRFDPPPSPATT